MIGVTVSCLMFNIYTTVVDQEQFRIVAETVARKRIRRNNQPKEMARIVITETP